MSVSALVSTATFATAFAAVSASVARRIGLSFDVIADGLLGPLGVSEAEIVRDLAASFETREG